MNKLVRNMLCAYFTLIFLLTACFNEGLEPCLDGEYYSYIRFVYDKNIKSVDAFHAEVSNVDVYLFDANGLYLDKLSDTATPTGSTFSDKYLMGLPERNKDAYQFVALGGFNDEQIEIPTTLEAGVSTISDFYMALRDRANNRVVNYALHPFWHGSYTLTKPVVERNDTTTISLTKNTNTVRIVLQTLDGNADLDVDDFAVSLTSANGRYNYQNEAIGQDYWVYNPYEKEKFDGTGVAYELQTMRILSDRENRFVITQTSDSQAVLDINLNRYISALKASAYSHWTLQEFMDRQEVYNIILFVEKDQAKGRWMVARVSINDWILREFEIN